MGFLAQPQRSTLCITPIKVASCAIYINHCRIIFRFNGVYTKRNFCSPTLNTPYKSFAARARHALAHARDKRRQTCFARGECVRRATRARVQLACVATYTCCQARQFTHARTRGFISNFIERTNEHAAAAAQKQNQQQQLRETHTRTLSTPNHAIHVPRTVAQTHTNTQALARESIQGWCFFLGGGAARKVFWFCSGSVVVNFSCRKTLFDSTAKEMGDGCLNTFICSVVCVRSSAHTGRFKVLGPLVWHWHRLLFAFCDTFLAHSAHTQHTH